MINNLLTDNIMRRHQSQFLKLLRTVSDNHQVTITDAGKKLKFIGSQIPIQGGNNLMRLIRRNVAGTEIVHETTGLMVENINQIATKGNVVRAQFNPHIGGFQRGSAGVVLFRTITKDRKVGNITARRKTFGDCHRRPQLRLFRKLVKMRS